ncbi:MAG: Ig domain-containing protein, partial [Bacteroidaceae bacterium]|nr:Ig domain-containing protein [Bacteroidaceae bacterium]
GEVGATPSDFFTLKGDIEPESWQEDLGTVYLFPHFTKPSLPYKYEMGEWEYSPLTLHSTPSNDLMLSCDLGMIMTDSNKNRLFYTPQKEEYKKQEEWYEKYGDISISVASLDPGTYYCYPAFKLWGDKFWKAGPYAKIDVPEPMSISTNSEVLPKGKTVYVNINGGWGYYSASSSNSSICTAEIVKNGQYQVKIVTSKSMTGPATVTVKDLRAGTTETILITVSGEFTPVTRIVLAPNELTMEYGESKTLLATVLPLSADNKDVLWSSSDSEVAVVSGEGRNATVTAVGGGSCTITCSATDGSGVYAECPVTVSSGTTPDPGNHEWVDLGLPSGTLWATCNVGANSPEEYGDYFAWGETEPKSTYSWANYIHCDGSEGSCHNLSDISGTQYDVAHMKWGGKWRIPTHDEQVELYENCTYSWTTIKGVWGGLFTSKINGNSIFLPAGGHLWGTSTLTVGSFGNYWSSTQTQDNLTNAFDFTFGGRYLDWTGPIADGVNIRPVRVREKDDIQPTDL